MDYARQRKTRAPPSGGSISEAMEEMNLDGIISAVRGMAMNEVDETFASDRGSEEDRYFDSVVGALEEAVMDSTFTNLQQSFVDEWCEEFDDVEENKLIYTDLFRQYTQLVERHLDGWLRQRIRGFDMETFMKMVGDRQDEIVGDVIDILTAVADFAEFKRMMVAHNRGRDHRLVVTSSSIGTAARKTADDDGLSTKAIVRRAESVCNDQILALRAQEKLTKGEARGRPTSVAFTSGRK